MIWWLVSLPLWWWGFACVGASFSVVVKKTYPPILRFKISAVCLAVGMAFLFAAGWVVS